QRRVTVIAAGGGAPSALAAKAATTTIPIVFALATDPVELGLVASLSRPGGHLTGVGSVNVEVGPKRWGELDELVPATPAKAVPVNPTSRALAEAFVRDLRPAADGLRLKIHVLHASSERDLDAVFASLTQLRAGALVIGPDVFFNERSEQLAALALRHAVP